MSTENKHERKMAVQDEAISKVQRIREKFYIYMFNSKSMLQLGSVRYRIVFIIYQIGSELVGGLF